MGCNKYFFSFLHFSSCSFKLISLCARRLDKLSKQVAYLSRNPIRDIHISFRQLLHNFSTGKKKNRVTIKHSKKMVCRRVKKGILANFGHFIERAIQGTRFANK